MAKRKQNPGGVVNLTPNLITLLAFWKEGPSALGIAWFRSAHAHQRFAVASEGMRGLKHRRQTRSRHSTAQPCRSVNHRRNNSPSPVSHRGRYRIEPTGAASAAFASSKGVLNPRDERIRTCSCAWPLFWTMTEDSRKYQRYQQ